MDRKTRFATIFVAVLCLLLTSGCFSIEQEVFLEPDGSGDLVAYISMPDFPEDLKKNAPGPQQDPQKLLDEFKQKFATQLPPTIKLKEAKEVRRHGAMAFYIVLHFNELKDVDSILDKFSKESLSEKGQAQASASKDNSLWKIQLEKAGDLTVITQRFYVDFTGMMSGALGMDIPESAKAPSAPSPPTETQASVTPKSAPKPAAKRITRRTARSAKPAAPKEENPFGSVADDPMKDPVKDPMKELLDEKVMGMIFSSIFKMRFVVHAPKQITETNADIVLNGKIAIWNASLGAFVNEKKPIEMKVAY